MQAFGSFLNQVNDGQTHTNLSVEFAELLRTVHDTGRVGTLTLKIKVKPASNSGSVDKVIIEAESKLDLPKPDVRQDMFWLTEDIDLSRNHPRQGSLELKVAGVQPLNINEVKTA